MDTALTHSVNTYFAQVGEKLGTQTMFEYMNRFGFNKDPELDYPDDQMAPSGVYDGRPTCSTPTTRSTSAGSRSARSGCWSTPLQMAEVAATVANDGKLMKPTFLQKAKDPDGRTIERARPARAGAGGQRRDRDEVTTMMTHVTEEGTAAGLTVGGRLVRRQDRHGGDRHRATGDRTGPGSSASRRPRTRRSRSR